MTEEALAGIWVDDAGTTVLLFSEDGIAYPALDIDYLQNDFSTPLVYYVSGIDDTHFWSNTQNKCFRRLA